ncbi:MAG: lipopolysaccharide biosynthesis protein [Vicinamibacteria bacterium]|nr:lipopolysaccharide biosynthesis protein [Vicinamibacteria bacterium]
MKPQDARHGRTVSEADDATRGSVIKLAAETVSRLITLATTVLITRALGVSGWGAFGSHWILAPLFAEMTEFGLQATASRALVAGTLSLRSLVRARIVVFGLVSALVLAGTTTPLSTLIQVRAPSWLLLDALAGLIFYFALSGWGEFLGVALRCRRARVQEGILLLALRSSGLILAAAALAAGAGFAGLAWALAFSPIPAIGLGAWLLGRRPAQVREVDASVLQVLRNAAPLAAYAGLLLLSPRVEFLVLRWVRGDAETGLFLTALNLLWPLSLVPNAVAAGAMPALTREALRGAGHVRQRTAAMLALFAAPAAVGLMIVAPGLIRFIFGADFAPAAIWLRLLALALIPMFFGGLLSWALIAAGRAALLPWLLAIRIAAAFLLALILVPRFGATGAAAGFVVAEVLLLVLGTRACSIARFAVPVVRPAILALAATAPMAFAVWGVGDSPLLALAVGVLTYGATLAAAWRLFPRLAGRLLGGMNDALNARRTPDRSNR